MYTYMFYFLVQLQELETNFCAYAKAISSRYLASKP